MHAELSAAGAKVAVAVGLDAALAVLTGWEMLRVSKASSPALQTAAQQTVGKPNLTTGTHHAD